MSFKFEKIIIWQKAMDFGEGLNLIAIEFPNHELYNLSSQIRRAGDSIALNISEGSILQTTKEFQKFIGYSIRSLAEVITCLYKARNRNYISIEKFELFYKKSYELMNMMIAFRKGLQ